MIVCCICRTPPLIQPLRVGVPANPYQYQEQPKRRREVEETDQEQESQDKEDPICDQRDCIVEPCHPFVYQHYGVILLIDMIKF